MADNQYWWSNRCAKDNISSSNVFTLQICVKCDYCSHSHKQNYTQNSWHKTKHARSSEEQRTGRTGRTGKSVQESLFLLISTTHHNSVQLMQMLLNHHLEIKSYNLLCSVGIFKHLISHYNAKIWIVIWLSYWLGSDLLWPAPDSKNIFNTSGSDVPSWLPAIRLLFNFVQQPLAKMVTGGLVPLCPRTLFWRRLQHKNDSLYCQNMYLLLRVGGKI